MSETIVRQTLSAGGSFVSSTMISTTVLSKSNGLSGASQMLLPGQKEVIYRDFALRAALTT